MLQYNNPLIVLLVRIANMMIVSFYWLLCCIPVVTILPACAALYHCVTRVVMGSGAGVTRDFFQSFKAALKPGVVLTVLAEVLGGLVCLGIYTGTRVWSLGIWGAAYMALGILIGLLGITLVIYLPPVLSRFEGGPGTVIRLALYFAGRNLLRSVWYGVLLAVGIWFVDFFPLLLLVMPALYTDLIRGGVEKSMNRYIEEAGLTADREEAVPPAEPEALPTALELEKLLAGEETEHGGH